LNCGGLIRPLIIPSELNSGLGLMNPSILIHNQKVLVNLRAVNYTFYHSERKLFQHPYGPLTYIHPENDQYLRTWNYYLELDDDYFGISVATSADGETIIVGAHFDEIGATTSTGVVYVFDQTRETYVYSGPTGNIGIGTEYPTYKLDVVGDARVGINTSQGVILTSANGTKYRLIISDAGVLSTILV